MLTPLRVRRRAEFWAPGAAPGRIPSSRCGAGPNSELMIMIMININIMIMIMIMTLYRTEQKIVIDCDGMQNSKPAPYVD